MWGAPQSRVGGGRPRAQYVGVRPRAQYVGGAPEPSTWGAPQSRVCGGAPQSPVCGGRPRAQYVGGAPEPKRKDPDAVFSVLLRCSSLYRPEMQWNHPGEKKLTGGHNWHNKTMSTTQWGPGPMAPAAHACSTRGSSSHGFSHEHAASACVWNGASPDGSHGGGSGDGSSAHDVQPAGPQTHKPLCTHARSPDAVYVIQSEGGSRVPKSDKQTAEENTRGTIRWTGE
ncbi:hypothetical protein CgunFtcFv8_006171 [Champsocephalus gunnari]|uniref:Uncharacterized protein n=1 Tax=Champsocephalus gunnari TaxID=52237 RepID=A0AAN8BZT7_CHAGU|nr:hypothetical protein CgunFtcFv8_006171 [Champsocephalus gunnari]